MRYFIGIDIGTSGTKTVLFSQTGDVIASYTGEYPLYQPQNGYAEQNPEDWWQATVDGLKAVSGAVPPGAVVGIGLSGQMHGLVMLDEGGQVIRPSIIWCDSRTAAECDEITRRVGAEKLISITANPALAGFTASKILWVRNHEPENYAKCRHILLPKDYIRYRLTGVFATDVSDASGMQLLDIKNRCWSDEVLRLLDIDKALLADVYESPKVTGRLTPEAAALTGLTQDVLVVAGAGDNAAAAVGTGVVKNGRAFTTIGTSGVVFAHTSDMVIDPEGRVHTFCCAVPGAWHVMGVTQGAGLSLKWFRDNFCDAEISVAKSLEQDPYQIMDNEAAQIPIGCDRLLYLPYLMGERTPHKDPDCRGVFFGLSALHTKKHCLRAVMEGVTYSLCDCMNILRNMNVEVNDMAACGGGAVSGLWRQMLADAYNVPIKRVTSKEGPALGAMILAAVGSGLYPTVEAACDAIIRYKDTLPPIEGNPAQYEKVYGVYKTLYPALKDAYKNLAKI